MKTFISLFVLLFTVLSSTLAWSQVQTSGRNSSRLSYRDFYLPGPRLEAGISLGAANAMTDLASSVPEQQALLTDVYARALSPSISLYGRYRFSPVLGIKVSASALMLRGDDRWSPDIQVVNRGKSFTNNVLEASMLGEIYMPHSYSRMKQDFRLNWMDLYLFTGFSVFYHHPKLKGPIIDNYDYLLINSDGIFNRMQIAVPFGMGVKWILANQWTLGMDINFRYTFFDYLDGFRRPYSNRNDHFYSGNLSIGYIINSKNKPSNQTVNRFVFDKSNTSKTRNARAR